ncbi:hypothetical protein COLO4_22841 [Corchorus olitorius]|uniref:non-specific serine/threonine protein kinase n=1 Tax=Corchorus olitorius TaxID=93759 RepID=A0A1R3IJL2_9ROSI|nr:hypothetical protein COLO4_22841 [Corchorus olitorius]
MSQNVYFVTSEGYNSWKDILQTDLSYNYNLSESSLLASCGENLNLFKSNSGSKNSGQDICLKNYPCLKDQYSVHINCGGEATTIEGINYEADDDKGGPAKYYHVKETWETSSTGHFWDIAVSAGDYIAQNVSILKTNNSELYTRARLSPLSLTYYFRCLANGSYTVTLHFAEIVIRDNRSFRSVGRRIFDVYVQEKLVLKDFNIKTEAKGVDKAVNRTIKTYVSNKTLTVRFHWAGKGTTAIPRRGTYGPLISAISVDSYFKPSIPHGGNMKMKFVVGAVVSALCLILIILGILWWKVYFRREMSREQVLRGLDLQVGFFTFRQMKAATNNFDTANKIGEGGFGSVYKGELLDGTIIAIKKLSSRSRQGDREFLNELGMISRLQHPNLVKMYGCCIEGAQLLGYMAPEYALWGYLTYKADVYSFGIVALEIVAGKRNAKHQLDGDFVCLQDQALVLQQNRNLMELVDPRLGAEFNKEEAIRMIK